MPQRLNALLPVLVRTVGLGAIAVAAAPLGGPSGLDLLRMMRNAERAVGNLAQNSGAGSDEDVVADLDRRNQLGVASDHAATADPREMLVVAVIVDGDHAASDISLAADLGIAQVAQMARLAARSKPRLLGLDEIADAVMAFELGASAQVGEGADVAMRPDTAFLSAHSNLQMAFVADFHVAQVRRALDPHAFADLAMAENLHVGTDDRVASDFDLLPDIRGCRIDDCHPRLHQPAVNRRPDLGFHRCQLLE